MVRAPGGSRVERDSERLGDSTARLPGGGSDEAPPGFRRGSGRAAA